MKCSHPYLKSVFRSIRNNYLLFISITLIVAVGIAFVTGVAGISPKLTISLRDDLEEHKVPDLIVKNKTGIFDEEQTTDVEVALDNTHKAYQTMGVFTVDLSLYEEAGTKETRIFIYPSPDNQNLNTLEILEGSWPTSYNEVAVQVARSEGETEYQIGDTITIQAPPNSSEYPNQYDSYSTYSQMIFLARELTVTAIVRNPSYYFKQAEYSNYSGYLSENGLSIEETVKLNRTVYFSYDASYLGNFTISTAMNLLLSGTASDIYIKSSAITSAFFEYDYISQSKEVGDTLFNYGLTDEDIQVLTNDDSMSYQVFTNVVSKIEVLAIMFPIFFIFIIGLVVLTSISKLIDEERGLMGCFESLGYPAQLITMKYVVFALICGILGSLIGLFVGAFTIPLIVYPAFGVVYALPTMTSSVSFTLGAISALLIVIVAVILTIYVCHKHLNHSPASLLMPKAPKPGKRTLIEKIKPIWAICTFKWKSTLRNIFRYPWRSLMVITSVALSSSLVFCGLALNSISGEISFMDYDPIDMSSTLTPIAWLIIIFAMALAVLVIFDLANMNISERKREIATLEVLGYYKHEVSGYIFREIILMCLIGIALGIPVGIGLICLVFYMMNFGGLEQVSWTCYLGSIIISIIFVAIVAVMLIPKIRIIDMNDSLKSVE